jgi:hypothetical protein
VIGNFQPFGPQPCKTCKRMLPLGELRPIVSNGVLVGHICHDCVEEGGYE